jgi:hypothetical protein
MTLVLVIEKSNTRNGTSNILTTEQLFFPPMSVKALGLLSLNEFSEKKFDRMLHNSRGCFDILCFMQKMIKNKFQRAVS